MVQDEVMTGLNGRALRSSQQSQSSIIQWNMTALYEVKLHALGRPGNQGNRKNVHEVFYLYSYYVIGFHIQPEEPYKMLRGFILFYENYVMSRR